ncbi:hypothetical protein L596_024840 [Steinernema carpocapsae]|uniref:Uncharacterized protein n=1 Tax=Steinernema carpocapsae TaxID=34508 RepID=A0A4U5M5Z3_STECR|nr:hypothetical protein L596_024840 [Steinernema carpocapsae]
MTSGCPEAASRLPAILFFVFFLSTSAFANCFKNKKKNPYKGKTLGDASKRRESSESENQGSSSNASRVSSRRSSSQTDLASLLVDENGNIIENEEQPMPVAPEDRKTMDA